MMRFVFLPLTMLHLLVRGFWSAGHHHLEQDGTILMQLSSHLSHLIVHQTFSRSGHPHRPCLHLCAAEMYLLRVLTLMDCGPVDRIDVLQLLYLWDCIKEEWVSGLSIIMLISSYVRA